jgi:subtilisin-like proprotein convertase family protein
VYLDASYGLQPPYTVWVRGARVNVNAATLQTNVIGQDYALVISSDDGALTASLGVTDLGSNSLPPEALVTVANNGSVLLHQRVGANEPNLAEYPGGLYPYPGQTNGSLVQWHFFLFTNVNYNLTNTTFTNSAGSNIATNYTNAIFATFLPPTLTVPVAAPVNESYEAANNADLDLYVSTNEGLLTLDPNVVAMASKSLGQGGSETVLMTNISSVPVFYIGVKSESQQGGDFAFFATLATNFDTPASDGSVTVSAYGLPVVIPDSFDAGGLEGADVFAVVATPMIVRKAVVTAGVEHSNPADLYGTLFHNGQEAVLNHFTGAPGGFTNTYDDLPDGTVVGGGYPVIASDGPGTLRAFIGQEAAGQWRLNEKDNVFTQTGMVTVLTLTVWPQPPNPQIFLITNLPANGSYYGYVDVPDYATNLSIAARGGGGGGALGIYLTNQEVVNTGDYGTNTGLLGGALLLYTNPALNLNLDPVVPNPPPLSGGRWYYDITNESGMTLNNISVVITNGGSWTPNLALTEFNNTLTPLGTDDHTASQICIPADSILASNQSLVSLQVGVRIAKTNADNLVLHLISPQGTSVELYEDRGGPGVTNLGMTATNGSYVYLNFTDDALLAPQLIKFVAPPYGPLPTEVEVYGCSFEPWIVSLGDYGVTNSLFPVTLGTNLEGWTVVSNDVAVVEGRDLYPAYDGISYLALSSGVMTNQIATVPGQPYTLTFAYRGPGLLDWWPMEGDFNDIIGANDGVLTAGGPVTNITGQVGQGIQFPSSTANSDGATINFGTAAGNFGTNDFSVDFWINTMSTNAAEAFLEKRGSCDASSPFWGIRIGGVVPAGILGFELDSGGGTANLHLVATYPINDGLWHHVVCVRKGMDHYIYIDGTFNSQLNHGVVYNVSSDFPLIMGTSVCENHDGTVPFTGAVDELDLWNRALTDVEIAAIYQAGSNHVGKADTTSILPNAEILLNGLTNTTLIAPASGTNWLTNTVYFTAVSSNITLGLQGHTLGMLFDDFVLQTPANLNYVQPEESLAPFTGQNPYGCWTLDVWDTRADASTLTNGVLLSWNLQMTVSSTNVSLVVLTNHVPYTAGSVASNAIAYFAFDVPAGADFDTNRLRNCLSNGVAGFPAPLNLLFDQTALPDGYLAGDYTLLAGVSSGAYVLTNDAPPPALLPGARYFLGVQNSNAYPVTFTLQVDTDILTNTTAIALTNAIAYANTLTAAPQYYSFDVPTNAVLASFEIINPASEVDLYARHALPLPSSATYDYQAAYQGTNDEAIVVATNSFNLLGVAITTNSVPVPLTPGTWYLAACNPDPNHPAVYEVVATYISNGAITLTPLTNFANGAYTTNGITGGTAVPGPDLTNFYTYTVTNLAATAVQFVVSNMSGNVDLIVRNGYLPTPQQMTDGSFNAGTTPQLITIVTNALLPSLVGTTWYLGVPNNTAQTVSFFISATTLTNMQPYTIPAIELWGLSAGAGGFAFTWTALPGAQYEVEVSSDLIHWTQAVTVTTSGYAGAYTDPTPITRQSARFYRVIRTQ